MAEHRPTETRRRREPEESLGRPDEVLLWLLIPGGTLIGWAIRDWNEPAVTHFGLRLPVMLHQVPMTSEGGQVGVAQLYVALQVDALQVTREAVVGAEVLDREGEVARLHAQAWRQRSGAGLLLARAGGQFSH